MAALDDDVLVVDKTNIGLASACSVGQDVALSSVYVTEGSTPQCTT